MQIARPAVITQTAPQAQHLIQMGSRQRVDIGKSRQKTLVIAQHGDHLGLLQHDFRQPDAVGVARVLPRQIMAAVQPLPIHQTPGKAVHGFWHTGQKKVERWPCTMRLMEAAHTRQGSPALSYTLASSWK